MKKIDIGQTIGIAANVGVIAGIIFLAIEIRQNTEAIEFQASAIANDRRTEDVAEYFRNADLRQAYIKFAAGEPLSQEEDFILSTYAFRIFVSWSWIYSQRGEAAFRVSSIKESFYRNPPGGLASPVLSHYWETYKDSADPEFRQWMEDNVVEN